jgi:hypothetical protein
MKSTSAVKANVTSEPSLAAMHYERLGDEEVTLGLVLRGRFVDLLKLVDEIDSLSKESLAIELIYQRFSVDRLLIVD